MPAGSAAAAASHPPVVSWSVSATTSSPAAAAAATTAAGESVPSDAVECVCRSMRDGSSGGCGYLRNRGRARSPVAFVRPFSPKISSESAS